MMMTTISKCNHQLYGMRPMVVAIITFALAPPRGSSQLCVWDPEKIRGLKSMLMMMMAIWQCDDDGENGDENDVSLALTCRLP